MRILIVSDAWKPQVNGVARTMAHVVSEGEKLEHSWRVISPGPDFHTFPLPSYPEIRVALGGRGTIEKILLDYQPDAVHIATEGPLGWAARAVCLKNHMPFTSSYHTRFPEYIRARWPVPLSIGYSYMRTFHKYSGRVMVTTPSMKHDLEKRGFSNLAIWSRGVDTNAFNPRFRADDRGPLAGLKPPIFAYVGRLAVEKNIDAFLHLDLPGSKLLVGDGPARKMLEKKYPKAHFAGPRFGDDLAAHFANADVFVFPSLTDTFGLVILEALASGLPVAAFDAPGPRDLLTNPTCGAIGDDLRASCLACLSLSRDDARAYAENFSWRACAQQFVEYLSPLPVPERRRFWGRFRRKPKRRLSVG